MSHEKQSGQNTEAQMQETPLDPNPVFIHYDRGLQEYGDLFSVEESSIEENETAETQSHRP